MRPVNAVSLRSRSRAVRRLAAPTPSAVSVLSTTRSASVVQVSTEMLKVPKDAVPNVPPTRNVRQLWLASTRNVLILALALAHPMLNVESSITLPCAFAEWVTLATVSVIVVQFQQSVRKEIK